MVIYSSFGFNILKCFLLPYKTRFRFPFAIFVARKNVNYITSILKKQFYRGKFHLVWYKKIKFNFILTEALLLLSLQFLKELHSSIPELPPIIVIATKIDLRETGDEGKRRQLLTSEEIRHFAKTINAVNYFECSAVKNVSIRYINISF